MSFLYLFIAPFLYSLTLLDVKATKKPKAPLAVKILSCPIRISVIINEGKFIYYLFRESRHATPTFAQPTKLLPRLAMRVLQAS